MESLNILHLSDFHIGNFRYEDPTSLAYKIVDTLVSQHRKVDIVIVSGDLFDGRSKTDEVDLEKAVTLFSTLVKSLRSENISPDFFDENCVLFVPGNHDLKRKVGMEYEKYDEFISRFYNARSSNLVIEVDKYNWICAFPEKKIAVLGFNSCRLEIEKAKDKDLKWVQDIDFSSVSTDPPIIKNIIIQHLERQIKWDDYGYINPTEMNNLFYSLRQHIPDYIDYNLIATFHHHFYPFPEIVTSHPDASFIRNYQEVLEKFQRYQIKLVLHGHKHLSIQRAITDNKYFDNPDSVIYVLSAGSVGCKDVYNPSFQIFRVFEKNSPILLEGEKYDFNDEELNAVKPIILPPQAREEKSLDSALIDLLKADSAKLFNEYYKITDDFETSINNSPIPKIIEEIGKVITVFKDIQVELRKNPLYIYSILMAINYRVIFHLNLHSPSNEHKNLLNRIEQSILKNIGRREYADNLLQFLSADSNLTFDKKYQSIIKNVLNSEKRNSAYISITAFICDLFMNIGFYGEHYFDKENLKYKVNITLEPDLFYSSIPNDSLKISANVDRRSVLLNFKCKNPTVHKIAVLIVKDFEMRLNRLEESLKEIKLKLYYLIPKVQTDKYHLENYQFEAYIPTLLPLLTGDNLYKQKEVFIRELVQNAIDATLLRRRLNPQETLENIRIEFGVEERGNNQVKFFKISDSGTGMSSFTIERYFTSIGRSFYVSEEFDDLKKKKSIVYNAISNFGIGFLSSFMVCREIKVSTRSIFDEDDTDGLEIEIPNYDGCFFINKKERDTYGTDITLYEDHRKLLNFARFSDYIKSVFLGLPLNLEVVNTLDSTKSFSVESFSLHRRYLKNVKDEGKLIFYVPFSEESGSAFHMTWSELLSSSVESIPKFGVWIDFSSILGKRKEAFTMNTNQGLRISEGLNLIKDSKRGSLPAGVITNFPSSFIQLDVAREKIMSLKENVTLNDLKTFFVQQIKEFLASKSKNLLDNSVMHINQIIESVRMLTEDANTLTREMYIVKIQYIESRLVFTIVKHKDIDVTHSGEGVCFFDTSNADNIYSILEFFSNIFLELRPEDIEKNTLEDLEQQFLKIFGEDAGKQLFFDVRDLFEFFNIRDVNKIMTQISEIKRAQLKETIKKKERVRLQTSLDAIKVSDLSASHRPWRKREFDSKRPEDSIRYKQIFKLILELQSKYSTRSIRSDSNSKLFVGAWVLRELIMHEIPVKDYSTFKWELKLEELNRE